MLHKFWQSLRFGLDCVEKILLEHKPITLHVDHVREPLQQVEGSMTRQIAIRQANDGKGSTPQRHFDLVVFDGTPFRVFDGDTGHGSVFAKFVCGLFINIDMRPPAKRGDPFGDQAGTAAKKATQDQWAGKVLLG